MAIYYVDKTTGDDSDTGLTEALAWETINKVNISSFNAGDFILFKRGEEWTESLIVPSSGSDGNLITFGAYGSGDAPMITATKLLTSWTLHDTNVWKATLTTDPDYCLFGNLGGVEESGIGNLDSNREFYWAANVLYVYAESNPTSYYDYVRAYIITDHLVDTNGENYIRIQQLHLKYFKLGLLLHWDSSNCEAVYCVIDGGALYITDGIGINLYGTSNKVYNCDIFRCLNGIQCGGGTDLLIKNSRIYANFNYGLYDSATRVTYSYCHFYGNSNKLDGSKSVSGGVDGGNNIGITITPAVFSHQRYLVHAGFGIDDIGGPGPNAYFDSVISAIGSYKIDAIITTSPDDPDLDWVQFNGWYSSGHGISSHSWSHQRYDRLDAFDIQYTGVGSACTMTVSINGTKTLTTAVTGGPGGEELDIDLTNASYDVMTELVAHINGLGAYTCTKAGTCKNNVHTISLADVGPQDIKTASYAAQLSKERLVKDELSTSKSALEANISGLTVNTYVWPENLNDHSDTTIWLLEAGYEGGRANARNEDNLTNGLDIGGLKYPTNVTTLNGKSEAEITGLVRAQIFQAYVWGMPLFFFCHQGDLTPTEINYIITALDTYAIYESYDDIVDWVNDQTAQPTTPIKYVTEPSNELDFRLQSGSPCINAGVSVGLSQDYAGNIVGALPDIGAYEKMMSAGGGLSMSMDMKL